MRIELNRIESRYNRINIVYLRRRSRFEVDERRRETSSALEVSRDDPAGAGVEDSRIENRADYRRPDDDDDSETDRDGQPVLTVIISSRHQCPISISNRSSFNPDDESGGFRTRTYSRRRGHFVRSGSVTMRIKNTGPIIS